jgi:hypothetical protein
MNKIQMMMVLGLGFFAACGVPAEEESGESQSALCADPEGCGPSPGPSPVTVRAQANGEWSHITVNGLTVVDCPAGTQCSTSVSKGNRVGVYSIRYAYATPRFSATGMSCSYSSFFNNDLGVPQTTASCQNNNVQGNVSATITW